MLKIVHIYKYFYSTVTDDIPQRYEGETLKYLCFWLQLQHIEDVNI